MQLKIGHQVKDTATGLIGELISIGGIRSTIVVNGLRRQVPTSRMVHSSGIRAEPGSTATTRPPAKRRRLAPTTKPPSTREQARAMASSIIRVIDDMPSRERLSALRQVVERLGCYQHELGVREE